MIIACHQLNVTVMRIDLGNEIELSVSTIPWKHDNAPLSNQFQTKYGELVLGTVDREHRGDVVKINYAGRPKSITIFGAKGSGKSSLLMLLANQLEYQGWPVLAIDPQREMVYQNQPNSDVSLHESLYKYGLAPRGMNMLNVSPIQAADADLVDEGDVLYYLELADFKRIGDASVREQVLAELLGIGDESAPWSILNKWSDDLPDTFQEWSDLIRAEAGFNRKGEPKVTGMGMTQRLNSLAKKVASFNRIARRKGIPVGRIYFPELLGNGVSVAVGMNLFSASNTLLSIYIKMALMDILRDRDRAKRELAKTGETTANLVNPPCICIPEVDVLAPAKRNPPAKENIAALFSKYRKTDVFAIVDTQKPQWLEPALVTEADYFIFSKPRSREELGVLVDRGLSRGAANWLAQNMFFDPSGGYPQQFGIVGGNGKVQLFYPFVSPGETFKESALA